MLSWVGIGFCVAITFGPFARQYAGQYCARWLATQNSAVSENDQLARNGRQISDLGNPSVGKLDFWPARDGLTDRSLWRFFEPSLVLTFGGSFGGIFHCPLYEKPENLWVFAAQFEVSRATIFSRHFRYRFVRNKLGIVMLIKLS